MGMLPSPRRDREDSRCRRQRFVMTVDNFSSGLEEDFVVKAGTGCAPLREFALSHRDVRFHEFKLFAG